MQKPRDLRTDLVEVQMIKELEENRGRSARRGSRSGVNSHRAATVPYDYSYVKQNFAESRVLRKVAQLVGLVVMAEFQHGGAGHVADSGGCFDVSGIVARIESQLAHQWRINRVFVGRQHIVKSAIGGVADGTFFVRDGSLGCRAAAAPRATAWRWLARRTPPTRRTCGCELQPEPAPPSAHRSWSHARLGVTYPPSA